MTIVAKREFYIPENHTEILEGKVKGSEVYFYQDRLGRPCAIGFTGRAAKPSFSYFYSTEQKREEITKEWLENLWINTELKRKRRAERNKPHTLKVGDILYTSWGYEQTNIDFYQVVEVPSPCFVILREIGSSQTDDEPAGSMQCYVMPSINNFIGGSFRAKVTSDNSVKIKSYAYARSWDGKKKHKSWYA